MTVADAPSPIRTDRGLNEYLRDAVTEACKEAMRPLIRQCIKQGVALQDLVNALKYVFVESAAEDFPDETGGSTARIAVLCGVKRPEVHAMRDTDPESRSVVARMAASVQVLTAWHSDPDFTGPYGMPLELSYDSPRGFDAICERYGDGLSTEEILEDLVRTGCVARTKRGKLKVLRRTYLSAAIDPIAFGYAGKSLRSLAETLEYNIENPKSRDKRFERRVWSAMGIRNSDLPAFNEMLNEAGQKFLEDLDSWITEREKALRNLEKIPGEIPRVYPGVGLFSFFHAGPVKRKKK